MVFDRKRMKAVDWDLEIIWPAHAQVALITMMWSVHAASICKAKCKKMGCRDECKDETVTLQHAVS